jgi:hypothetical protein
VAIEILVKPEIDDASLDKSAAEMEAVFKAASERTGKQIQDNLSTALTKASVTAVDAAGRVSVAESKLSDVREKAALQF